MTKKQIDDGEMGEVLSPYQRGLELRRAERWVAHLQRLDSKDGRLPEGVDSSALARAVDSLRDVQAVDLAAAALVGGIEGTVALAAFNRARRALHALAPVVLMRLADKIDDRMAPGSERILVEMAKGIGLLVPGAPLDDAGREKAITRDDLRGMSDAELRERLKDEDE